MNVQAFSERVGLSSHTVRYYDRIGLLGPIQRQTNGHRVFAEADVAWMSFVHRLRETGMPIQQMLKYAQLRQQGDSTLQARRLLLKSHAEALRIHLAEQQTHLDKLAHKIEHYDQLIEQAGLT